ncbi:MAG: F0F1 ATP synthase subunit alpha [Mycoplasmataceae bacterium]|nr:F0F1 ATP synthase subunit alpha [Mycoplasmataceae bacterium]
MSKVIELSTIIKEKIKNYNLKIKTSEEGKVLTIADGIASVSGLDKTKSGELLVFPKETYGMALNLEEDSIGVIIFGSFSHIKEGDLVFRTNEVVEVSVGNGLIGRIIDPLGKSIDGKGKIIFENKRPIERIAPGIMTRKSVSKPMETGILSIDSMIPIGKGQRELIIGDKKTGKTSIAIDTILNQKGKNVKCVYVSIGQKNSTLANTVRKLENGKAMEYTTIVAANASESNATQYIAPYSAMAIAEEWMEKGEDVLIIFDDLTKHAVAYRAVSLLLRRPPGREAYPGDVFYLHSRLLERSANLNEKYGGGSITALPIVETQAGDISAYIPTNVISITDGQIFLITDLFNAGHRPAVDAGQSVSRVGGDAQTKLIKKLSGTLKLKLASYNELKTFSQFASDLDPQTKNILDNGEKIMSLMIQKQYSPYSQEIQAFILFIISEDMLKNISLKKITEFKNELIKKINSNKELKLIKKEFVDIKELKNSTKEKLIQELNKFIKEFNK